MSILKDEIISTEFTLILPMYIIQIWIAMFL